jgi:hypothetical protein
MKNSSQRFWLLFTSAQEISTLACELCTNGWEKGLTPFVKVVEGWLIYNFPIYRLDHFSSKNWRKTSSNRAKRNSNGPTRATRATSRATPSRCTDPPPGARTPRPASDRRSVRGVLVTVARYGWRSLGSRPAPRVPLSTAGRRTASPPLARRPTHAAPIHHRTCRATAHTLTPQSWCARNAQPPRAGYKSLPLFARKSRACAAVRHGCHMVSSTLGLRLEPIDPRSRFSSTTRTPCATHWLAQPLPPLEFGPRQSPLSAWTLPGEFHAPAVLAADRRFKPPL